MVASIPALRADAPDGGPSWQAERCLGDDVPWWLPPRLAWALGIPCGPPPVLGWPLVASAPQWGPGPLWASF